MGAISLKNKVKLKNEKQPSLNWLNSQNLVGNLDKNWENLLNLLNYPRNFQNFQSNTAHKNLSHQLKFS